MTLDIVIVNWNTGRQLRDCLESVADAGRDGIALGRVVVVDNASRDGSAERLDDLLLPLEVVRNPGNRGFAAACNQGAALGRAPHLLFLNPDTRLLAGSLAGPVAFLERSENREVGICGVQLVDDRGKVARTCARFPAPRHFAARMLGLDRLLPGRFPSHHLFEWDHADSREVDHVIGAFYLVRRSLFEALGGFDERFFVYLEDLDFSYRARQAGWRSHFLAEARAYHRGGGASEQVRARRLFYSLQSRILYGYKHFGWWSATGLLLGTLLLEPLARVGLALRAGSAAQLVETLSGFALLWRAAPRWITGRTA